MTDPILPNRNVTTKEIARRLQVSRATVSIVLNGRSQQRSITPETTRRVLDAAKELGYVPNIAARNLRRQRSGVIGVVLANFRMEWAEQVMTGMLDVFDQGGFTPFVATHRFDADRHRKELQAALQRHDEGVICQPLAGQEDLYREFIQRGVPLVFIGDQPLGMPETSFAAWDSGAAAKVAVEHLIKTGRKRIGHIGLDYPMRMSTARVAAYRAAVTAAGLPLDERWIVAAPPGQSLERRTEHAIDRIFAANQPHPDALFVLNDSMALPVLEILDARRIRVPEDVAVIGMGDLPLTGHRAIGLSTVREPCEQMGAVAAATVLDLVSNPLQPPIQRAIASCDLRIRRTTAGAAAAAAR